VFLASKTVAMVIYCFTKILTSCSSMVGQIFDTMIVASGGGIEWSLRALASMRAVRLFLQAQAVIKYVLHAASTLKNTDAE